MRKFSISIALTAFMLGGLPGCSDNDSSNKPELTSEADASQHSYEREILDWRADRIQRLQKPDGWLSLVGMHWLTVGTTQIGSGADNGTKLNVGPSHLGMLTLEKDGKLTLLPEADAGILIDDLPAQGPVSLLSDADPEATPTVVSFNKGDASFIVIKRGDLYALRVRDALAPTRTGFTGIDYFPIDPSFRFQAKFTPHAPGKTIDIINILSMTEPMANPGTVTFEKDGKQFTLEAVDEGDHSLFLIYADRTSGHESYAAARFLYADYPGADGMTTVDFNKGYNPPCAFTPYSTCPMPPAQNRLDLAITAGEKKPRKPGGSLQ